MKISSTFLRSKVARRIFFLFVVCALVPIAILAVFSIREVTQQLTLESEARLLQATRAEGMSIYERLTLLEAELKVIEAGLPRSPASASFVAESALPRELQDRFAAMAVVGPSGDIHQLFGTVGEPKTLSRAATDWIESGHTAVSIQRGDGETHILMSRLQDAREPSRGRIVAEINAGYLWGVAALPVRTELCVFDEVLKPLYCSAAVLSLLSPQPKATGRDFLPEYLRRDNSDTFVTRHWEVFLKPQFAAPRWTVVLGEPRSQALALLVPFESTFPYVTLLAIWLVTLLSLIQIRRNLVPLERLQEATQRMSGLNFGTPVTINSNDEFAELAQSFNEMADRLSRQFQALESINQIDRAILSSLETETIVSTVLSRLGRIVTLDGISISVAEPKDPHVWKTYLACGVKEAESGGIETSISEGEFADLRRNPDVLFVRGTGSLPGYLEHMARRGMKSFVVLPLILNGKVRGIIAMGFASTMAHSDEQIFQARQVADQVAVALSNAFLIQQLADLHVGTLTALARAIDAKSAWTSGHSERVTAFAMRIGRAMGLPQKELENLYRGGLLHDIGKIGISPGILDKPGRLTAEETREMREHVRIGVRILEPIPGLQNIIPVVQEHHEWFDGSGYPDGLAGEAINLKARIFALADCYDALTSERPYRPALPHAQVMEMIRQETGTHFDPTVVKAFRRMMAEEATTAETQTAEPVGVAEAGEL